MEILSKLGQAWDAFTNSNGVTWDKVWPGVLASPAVSAGGGCNSTPPPTASASATPPPPPPLCPDHTCRLTPDKSQAFQGMFGSGFLTVFYIWNFKQDAVHIEFWNHDAKQDLSALENMLRPSCEDASFNAGNVAKLIEGMKKKLEDHYAKEPSDKNENTLVDIAAFGNISGLDHDTHKAAVKALMDKANAGIESGKALSVPASMQQLAEACDLFSRLLENDDWIDKDKRYSTPKVKGGPAHKEKAQIEDALKAVEKLIEDLKPGKPNYIAMDPLQQNWVEALRKGIAGIKKSMAGGTVTESPGRHGATIPDPS